MTTPRYCVTTTEIDGVELAFAQELALQGSNVYFDNTTNGFIADNSQQAIEEAKETATGFFAQEVLVSTNLSSTTTNAWTRASGWPQTSSVKLAGDYIIDFTAQVGQSDKEKIVGSRLQYRFNEAGSWLILADSDIRDALSADDEFQYRTSFAVLTVPSDGDTIQWRWQFGQTDDGGVGRIKNTAVKITRRA